jgi:hypothetical protein
MGTAQQSSVYGFRFRKSSAVKRVKTPHTYITRATTPGSCVIRYTGARFSFQTLNRFQYLRLVVLRGGSWQLTAQVHRSNHDAGACHQMRITVNARVRPANLLQCHGVD